MLSNERYILLNGIRQGLTSGTPEEIKADEEVREAYWGEEGAA